MCVCVCVCVCVCARAGTRVVRVMPNTPLLVGCGAAAYCIGRNARAEDERAVTALLGASSTLVSVDEEKMDAVGGVGSAPNPKP